MKKQLGSTFTIIQIIACGLLLAISCLAQTVSQIPTDFQSLKKVSSEELEIKTQAHVKLWRLGSSARWDLLQETGDLIFSFADGMKATAPAQIIGTFNSRGKTWMWAWANSSVNDSLKKDAQKLREYGEKHRIEQLTRPVLTITEEEAWAMTAVAVKVCGEQGAYRGPAGENLFVFMSFGEVKLNKK